MKLTRLTSYRLMTENYNDSEKVSVSEVVAKLPEFGCLENGKPYTEKDTQKLVQGGQTVTKPVTSECVLNGDKTPVNKGERHGLTPLGIPCLKETNGGERGIHARLRLRPRPGRGSPRAGGFDPPGQTYTFIFRALGGSTGSGDWSDPVSQIAV